VNKMIKKDNCQKLQNRRGFTVLFIFLVLLIILFAQVYSQSDDIQRIARLQRRAIEQNGVIRPVVDSRVGEMLEKIDSR